MTIFISGGAKNGKSDLAQNLALRLAGDGKRYYVATMVPCDEEDHARIRSHLQRREGLGFETVECGRSILKALRSGGGTYLLDSVTALLLNELFPDPTTAQPDEAAAARCMEELIEFAHRAEHAVIVSDGIYSDAARYDGITSIYRRWLGTIDCALARVCNTVLEVSAGTITVHKGGLPQ